MATFSGTGPTTIDAGTYALANARYTLLVDRASFYDINELEYNDIAALATPLVAGVVALAPLLWWGLPGQGRKRRSPVPRGRILRGGLRGPACLDSGHHGAPTRAAEPAGLGERVQ